jgi:hypothetical protein
MWSQLVYRYAAITNITSKSMYGVTVAAKQLGGAVHVESSLTHSA